jgi:dimethylargininase
MRFRNAIIRKPSRSIINGLSSVALGIPDYDRACEQHSEYVRALEGCGLKILALDPLEEYPDSTFVEDVALLTTECAIITRPGAKSREGEIEGMEGVLKRFFETIYKIESPGTVEAGDIMMVGKHFYIGISERTNINGASQVINILEKHGMTGSTVKLNQVLHLKTGVSYLENNNLLACGEFLDVPDFRKYNILEIHSDEAYAANCIWVNGTVLVPLGYPKALKIIREAGYPVIELDVSEFRKLDGGLSCLSLRF